MFSVGGVQNLNIVNNSIYSFFVHPPLILLGFLKVGLYYNFGVIKSLYFHDISITKTCQGVKWKLNIYGIWIGGDQKCGNCG